MELLATTPGLYPLPDWAKAELSELKGHQKGDLIDGSEGEPVRAAYDRVRTELLETQTSTGLDRVVEGQARWDDLLAHPLAVHDAVETGGLVRYYDNNNFYRDPVVRGKLTPDGDLTDELGALDGVDGPTQAVLPGPYTLAALATDEHYGDDADFLAAVAEFLAGELAAAPAVDTAFLLEPSLVADPPGDGADERASAALDRVATAVDAEVVCHTYWGALEEKVHAHLLDAGVDAVGYDLLTDREATLYLINEYGTRSTAAFGLADGTNTRLEDAETLVERVEWVRDQTPGAEFERAYLTTTTPLVHLPYRTFEAKVERLGAAVERAEVAA